MKIKIEDIVIKDGRRAIDDKKVKEMSESIAEIGLINPIIINKDNVLIAGAHRIEAYKLLGKTEIEANVITADELTLELIEIDENYCRSELHFIERGELLNRRKAIYEELHPEAKVGGDRGNQYTGGKSSNWVSAKSFVKDTIDKTGRSKASINRELMIAKNIVPEAKEVIKEKNLNQSQALEIARLEPSEQMAAAQDVTKLKKKEKVMPKKKIIKFNDVDVNAIIEDMAKKEPSGDGSTDNNTNSIVIEIINKIKLFRADIVKYVYSQDLLSGADNAEYLLTETNELIDELKILSKNLKEN